VLLLLAVLHALRHLGEGRAERVSSAASIAATVS
jgi:hypothetical protein